MKGRKPIGDVTPSPPAYRQAGNPLPSRERGKRSISMSIFKPLLALDREVFIFDTISNIRGGHKRWRT
jgi:hypothetical protein